MGKPKIDRRTLLREAARRIDPYRPDGRLRAYTDLHELEDRQVAALLRKLSDRPSPEKPAVS